jgi:transposase-like protein
MAKPFPPEVKARAKELMQQGVSQVQIAHELGCSLSWLRQFSTFREQIKLRNEQILELWHSGLNGRFIAKRVGVTQATLYKIISNARLAGEDVTYRAKQEKEDG